MKKYRSDNDIRDDKIRSLEFNIDRLKERIEKLERTKADKMKVYENWDRLNK